MVNELLILILLSLLGGVFGLLGGIVFLFNKKLSNLLQIHSIPFAAGVLITVSFLGIIPEALDSGGESIFLTILLAFICAYIFEQLFLRIHHHSQELNPATALVVIGDTIHNFIDGVAIGVSFLVSPGLGLITSVSTLLHEIPHEISDFGILLQAGWDKKRILVVNIVSALFTVAGALGVFFFLPNIFITGHLLAVSAGIFIYLGASDFLPEIGQFKQDRIKTLTALLTGVLVMLSVLLLVPHTH